MRQNEEAFGFLCIAFTSAAFAFVSATLAIKTGYGSIPTLFFIGFAGITAISYYRMGKV
jgi:hypothetical protein